VGAMSTILPFITRSETAFDDDVTRIMGLAFDSACAGLHQRNLSQVVREVIAERIIEAAKRGERDLGRLSSFAIDAIKGDRKTG
jgi:hypothetical protein